MFKHVVMVNTVNFNFVAFKLFHTYEQNKCVSLPS